MNLVVQTPDQHFYLKKLLRYDYVISYELGKSNILADALSRRDDSISSQHLILYIPSFDSLSTL